MSDLRTIRDQAGLTRLQAAALLRVSNRTYEGWEAGKGARFAYLSCVCRLLAILTGQEAVRVRSDTTPPT